MHATVGGAPITLTREIVYRYRDQANGEIRRPIFVTGDFDVDVMPTMIVWPVDGAAGAERAVTVSVTNRIRGGATAVVRLAVPPGWAPVPPETVAFSREDESRSVTFTVRLPPNPATGSFTLRATATGTDGITSRDALTIIDYPHIRPRPSVHPSTVEIRVAKILLPGLARVGYVRGAADRVPEALARGRGAGGAARCRLAGSTAICRATTPSSSAAAPTRPIPPSSPRTGACSTTPAAAGCSSSSTSSIPSFRAASRPYRLSIAQPHDRVTDETAPMTPLDSGSPVFHSPNDITADDWQRMGAGARAVLRARLGFDLRPGARDRTTRVARRSTGGLLVAPLGRGTYVYTGLSFFRQLPAGVVGAYRLFANLLGLKAKNVP